MASLLTTIGAGLVVGQGRRIEAAEEAQEKADAVRAQKLQEFDFAKQLQESKLQGDIKLKQMEIGAKYKEESRDLEPIMDGLGITDEASRRSFRTSAGIIGVEKTTAGWAGKVETQRQGEEKRAEEAFKNIKDSTGQTLEPAKAWNEGGTSKLVPPKVDPDTGAVQPYSTKSTEHQDAVILANTYKNTIARNLRMLDNAGNPTENARYSNDALNLLASKLTEADMAIKLGNNAAAKQAIATLDQFGDSIKITNEEWNKILEDSPSGKLLREYNKQQNTSQGSSAGGGGVPQEGGEVQGTVMPNEVKQSPTDLPPVENYPEGKILKNPDTGMRIKKINGKWTNL